jgi:hypothetical protein
MCKIKINRKAVFSQGVIWGYVMLLTACAIQKPEFQAVASADSATVQIAEAIRLVSVDGQPTTSNQQHRNRHTLIPGRHILGVKYAQEQQISVFSTRVVYSDPVNVTVNAQPGKVYRITAQVKEGKNWKPVVKTVN